MAEKGQAIQVMDSWLTGTISEDVRSLVVGLRASQEVWKCREHPFSQASTDRTATPVAIAALSKRKWWYRRISVVSKQPVTISLPYKSQWQTRIMYFGCPMDLGQNMKPLSPPWSLSLFQRVCPICFSAAKSWSKISSLCNQWSSHWHKCCFSQSKIHQNKQETQSTLQFQRARSFFLWANNQPQAIHCSKCIKKKKAHRHITNNEMLLGDNNITTSRAPRTKALRFSVRFVAS